MTRHCRISIPQARNPPHVSTRQAWMRWWMMVRIKGQLGSWIKLRMTPWGRTTIGYPWPSLDPLRTQDQAVLRVALGFGETIQ